MNNYEDKQAVVSGPGLLSQGPHDQPRAHNEHDIDHPFDVGQVARYPGGFVLGWGGMGQVSTVTDGRLRREVALKRVGAGTDDEMNALERRLAQEAWISAQLEHPGIVPIYDAGRGVDGRLYFTMRLIRGRSLRQALADGDLTLPALLRRFLAVCQAMGYAHDMGVVHRDLKPSNIMLGAFGETQIVDWGLARWGDQDPAAAAAAGWQVVPEQHTANTMAGAVLGTPAYMSPEQANGGDIGPPSDVFGLGAILFELLTGRALHAEASTAQIFKTLHRGPIPATRAAAPGSNAELAAIADRALAFDPAQRYAHAGALAADLEAYLDGRQVGAYRYSAMDHVKRFVGRFRLPLIVAAIALVATGVAVGIAYNDTLAERDRAQAAEEQVRQSLGAALVARAEAAAKAEAPAEAQLVAARALTLTPSPKARGVLAMFGAEDGIGQDWVGELPPCRKRHLLPGGRQLACVEGDALSLWDLAPLHLNRRFPLVLDGIQVLDDAHLLVAETGKPYDVVLLNVHEGTRMMVPIDLTERTALGGQRLFHQTALERPIVSWAIGLGAPKELGLGSGVPVVSRDGNTIAVIKRQQPTQVAIQVDGRNHPPLMTRMNGILGYDLSRDGQWLAVGGVDGVFGIVNTGAGTETYHRAPWAFSVERVAWSFDGQWLLLVGSQRRAALYHPRSATFAELPRRFVADAGWRDDGRLVTIDDQIRVYRVAGPATGRIAHDPDGISVVAVGPDGAVAIGAGDGSVTEWREAAEGAVQRLPPGDGVVKGVAFHQPSHRLVVIRAVQPADTGWAVDRTSGAVQEVATCNGLRRINALADGRLVATTYGLDQVAFALGPVDGVNCSRVAPNPGTYGRAIDSATSNDQRTTVLLYQLGSLWLVKSGEPTAKPLALREGTTMVAVSNHGAVAAASAHEVALLERNGERQRVLVSSERIVDVALSAAGDLAAVGTSGGRVAVYSVATGELLMDGRGHGERTSSVAFGPAGRWLYSGGWDGVVRRWDLTALTWDPEGLDDHFSERFGINFEHALSVEL